MAAMRNSNYYELALVHPDCGNTHPPVYDEYDDDLTSVDEDGCVDVPYGPGLGVEYDWSYVEDNRLGGRVYD